MISKLTLILCISIVVGLVQPIDICLHCNNLDQQCCEPNYRGPGDCFNPPEDSCCKGLVCRNGQKCCPRGMNSDGGCFAPAEQQCCDDGMVCGQSQKCCDGFCGNENCKVNLH